MLISNKEAIIVCKKCLYPSNHPLNLAFNSQGICTGCLVHEEKDNFDWDLAYAKLIKIIEPYKNQEKYDCIVPVSGGNDSYYIVHFVKNVLKLNPLLVTYNRHYNTALGIQHLERLRTRLGCDIVTFTIAPSKYKAIMQQTLSLMGSIHWAYLAGATVFPVQVAVKRNIPLIIWGAHQGIDQVGMFFHKDEVEMTRRYRKEHDLLGFEPEDLVDKATVLTEKLLSPLFYPSDKELNKVGVRGIYLNNYIYWDSKKQHESMIQMYGYHPCPLTRTFDSYNNIDCQYYMDVHDHIKYLKFGYSKVMDDACREIRLGRLTRENAKKLVSHFQRQSISKLEKLLGYLEISEKKFYEYINPFKDERIGSNSHKPEEIVSSDNEIESILLELNFRYYHTKKTEELFNSSHLLMRGWASENSLNEAF